MRKVKQYIAWFFFLIFIFPLIYQANHVLYFPHEVHCEHNSHSTSEHLDYWIFEEKCKNECGICQFLYSKQIISKIATISFLYEKIEIKHFRKDKSPFIFYKGYNKSLRAPPA